jgi:hypothetical protein
LTIASYVSIISRLLPNKPPFSWRNETENNYGA